MRLAVEKVTSGIAGDERRRRRQGAVVVLGLLAVSLSALALAPLLMPASYSIVRHTVSESAAQGVPRAWLARIGFLCLGSAVLALVWLTRSQWGRWGRIAFRVYGVSMIAVAVFSHMPWEDVPYDRLEDALHSIAAFLVGTSFTIGVVLVALRRKRRQRLVRVLDIAAIAAAIGVSLLMLGAEETSGLIQRFMFVVAYLWFGMEALTRPGEVRVGPRDDGAVPF